MLENFPLVQCLATDAGDDLSIEMEGVDVLEDYGLLVLIQFTSFMPLTI